MAVELNTFFLKFCLWIPPQNPLIVYRLVLWWLIAIPTIREYNTYLQDRYNLAVTWFKLYNVYSLFYLDITAVPNPDDQWLLSIWQAHMLYMTVYMCQYASHKWSLSTSHVALNSVYHFF
jgi:phosphatidylserine synthase 2